MFKSISFHKVRTIIKKELSEQLNSGQFYVITIGFLLVIGALFAQNLFLVNRSDLYNFFNILPIVLMVFIPVLTMSSYAAEKNSGTLELLLTMPFKDVEVMLGKFFSMSILYMLVLAATIFYPITIALLGDLDIGQMFCGYLAAIILGMAFISIGLFASSLTKSQITAFIISFGLIFLFIYLAFAAAFISGFFGTVLSYLSCGFHYNSMLRGVIDTRTVIYFASFILFFNYLLFSSLERRKW